MFRFPVQLWALGLAVALLHPACVRAAEEGPALVIVTGLAAGDLLNVRAAASPLGHTRTRLPNGTALKASGCGEFKGYQWCKVEVVDQPDMNGWVPARYLLAVDPHGTATTALPALDEAEMKAGAVDAAAAAIPEEGDAGGEVGASAAPAVPSDLAARFGDGSAGATAAEAGKKASGSLTEAEINAYRLAFAARTKATAAAKRNAANQAVSPAPDTMSPGGDVAASQEAGAGSVPVPTPRPNLKDDQPAAEQAEAGSAGKADARAAAPAADETPRAAEPPTPQTVALADPQGPAPAWDATGEIPCARYVGQPMTRCRIGIKRDGDGKADVTVTWPDGGTRVISFYDGKPAGANSRGEFRFTREGGLNMIRLGTSERFEITDTLAFGD